MQLTLLLPSRRHGEGAIAARWLGCGDRLPDAAAGREAALRECFAIDEFSPAALSRSLDAPGAGDALWLRADPAFVMADAMTLRLVVCGDLELSAEDVEALTRTLQPLFAQAGLAFDAPHPWRWYLCCPRDAKLPEFSPPEAALGDDLARHLPEGENARYWRGLLNEAQIVLTQHPLNARRAQRGLPPVNSLWFWGAGALPAAVGCGYARVYSDDVLVAALSRLAGVATSAPLGDAQKYFSPSAAASSADGAVLIDLAACRDAARLEADWLVPIDAALRSRRIGRLELRCADGTRCVVKPAHRWRFWQRTKTVA
jgi:hypothetical protein